MTIFQGTLSENYPDFYRFLYFQEVPYAGDAIDAVFGKIRTKGKTLLKKSGNNNFDDLISRLLEADPNKRISWEEYFKHPFFNTNI